MPTLFSYCILYDNGAAPNPFWRVCTLNICKPVIRRVAKPGDWIVGTGSSQLGFENKVVYAMEVTRKMSMAGYDSFCRSELPNKIPSWRSKDFKKRVGDCIYDFSTGSPRLITSVHNKENIKTDLSGKFTLLSDHFYYFGNKPVLLPDHLLPIVKQGQGHKSTSNQSYFHEFIDWILTRREAKNKVYSQPYNRNKFGIESDCFSQCAKQDKEQDESDEELQHD